MSPSLSKLAPVDIALHVQQNNGEILKLLMGNFRMLMERKKIKIDNGITPRKTSSSMAFGRTNSSNLEAEAAEVQSPKEVVVLEVLSVAINRVMTEYK